jgi:prepilin-type N-terminal cleavage/methylation domain-containing protein
MKVMKCSINKILRKTRGFTLVEMAISIGIFSIITSVVIFNHGKFNSSIVVTNLSYEVALAVRQAQVYGLAVKQEIGSDTSFEYAYGVYFAKNSQSFYIFADKDGEGDFDLNINDPCDNSGTYECQERIEVRGDVQIYNLETEDSNGINEVDNLTVLFLRPNPVAIIRDNLDLNNKQRAIITLRSNRADKEKQIVVELSGQISVRDVPTP